MPQQTNAQIDAKIEAAYTGGADRVEWVNELKIICKDLNDSMVNNNEFYKVEVDYNGAGTFEIPAGYGVRALVIETAATQLIKIGDTAGADDIFVETEIDNSRPVDLVLSITAERLTARTIHITTVSAAKFTYHLFKLFTT